MKILILSKNEELYSTKSLREAAEKRGHEVKVMPVKQCYMNIASKHPNVHFEGKEVTEVDAIIPRIGSSVTFYGCSVVRQFEMMGVYTLNESSAILRSRDKLRATQILSGNDVNIPTTGFANSPNNIKDLIKMVGGAPLVIKLLEGTQGIGVVLAENQKASESVIQAFMGLKANIMVQQYIKESAGSDVRCFVIGDKVVASMMRTAAKGEFRSNLHRGGEAKVIKITPAERKAAVKAAKILGLNVAGVDLIRSEEGPMVLEVNSSPGLEGIEQTTGKDVAGQIIEFIEKNIKQKRRIRG